MFRTNSILSTIDIHFHLLATSNFLLFQLHVHSISIFNICFICFRYILINPTPIPTFCFWGIKSFCLHFAHMEKASARIAKAHAHRKSSIIENDLFFFFSNMAGIGGLLPLGLFHQGIEHALKYDKIYIVNYHSRELIFGDLFDDTKGKSHLDIEIDPCKVVASLIKYPRDCLHEQTQSGVPLVSYENAFNASLGTCQDSDPDDRGYIVFIKISQERHPEFRRSYDYFLLTLIISKNWRIFRPNGPHCQWNPNQPIISHTSILREIGDTQAWASTFPTQLWQVQHLWKVARCHTT